MQKKSLPALGFITICLLVFWSCTKLDTTNLGVDLIPEVDNINTFRDSFDIVTSQGIFNDTSVVTIADGHALGNISNDPLFGSTEANIFLQPKPTFYPYVYGNGGDTLLAIDSAVLCLAYSSSWGDTTVPQQLQVYRIDDRRFSDSSQEEHDVNYQPVLGTVVSPVNSVNIARLKDTIRFGVRDTFRTVSQIRIKLNQDFVEDLFDYRDTAASSTVNALRSDSLYRRFFNGFAVKAVGGGNALMYINLTSANTRLEVHVRVRKNNVVDTMYNSFYMNTAGGSTIRQSSSANYVKRVLSAQVINPPANELYLQTTPGSFVNLAIDTLATLSNRVVHRAELLIQQLPNDVYYDSAFSVPNALYVDVRDTTSNLQWKPVYYDLNPSEPYSPDNSSYFFPSSVSYTYFGANPKSKTSPSGGSMKYYSINLTRHIQQMITRQHINYRFRLYAPFSVNYPQYRSSLDIPYANPIAYGRIRLAGGQYPDVRYRMRMIITWSKL